MKLFIFDIGIDYGHHTIGVVAKDEEDALGVLYDSDYGYDVLAAIERDAAKPEYEPLFQKVYEVEVGSEERGLKFQTGYIE